MAGSPQPSTELVEMVAFIGDVKDSLPLHQRGFLNTYGFYVQRREGSTGLEAHYKAGGRFISKLEFSGIPAFLAFLHTRYVDAPYTAEEAQLKVTKYSPGEWEEKVKPTYLKTKRIDEAIRAASEAMRTGDKEAYAKAQEAFAKALQES